MDRRTFTASLLATALVPGAGRAATPLALTAHTRTLEVNGKAATVYGLTGPDGKPGLSLAAGEMHDVTLTNALAEPTMIHWHGLIPQWPFDGAPDLPLPLLKGGEVRGYQLPGGLSGTHWMHAHTLQEQGLLAAPLIVRSKEDLARDEQEIVVLLHDFSFTPAEELLARLKGGGTGVMDHSQMGMGGAMPNMQMGGMMMGMDVNDIEYDAYLANDRTLDDPEVHQVGKGGIVRLRIINGATATNFIIDTGALAAEVVAVDGQDLVAMPVHQFPLSMGQRADIRLTIPKDGGAFPIFALREGAPQRTGIILATPGANVARIAAAGEAEGPVLDLSAEMRLVTARPLAPAEAKRRFRVMLHGNMQTYQWAMMANTALRVAKGERVEVELQNHSMMTHPMHLHGHHFQIVAVNGQRFAGARRDTVIVPHMNSVTFAFDADNPGGGWAFHCHHLYHMASGMMSAIGYEGV